MQTQTLLKRSLDVGWSLLATLRFARWLLAGYTRAVAIHKSVKTVIVRTRDQKYGYGGKTVQVNLPGR